MDSDVMLFCLIMALIIGFCALAYFVSNNKIKGRFKPLAQVIVGVVTLAGILLLLAGFTMVMYKSADEAGWFPHDRIVAVWMPHDWLVGEFEECVSGSDVKTLVLFCGHDEDETSPHQMNVEIRGSMDVFESKKPSKWNCQRKEESISCKSK